MYGLAPAIFRRGLFYGQYYYLYLMKFYPVKNVLFKWLASVIVLLGVFTFSGLSIQIAVRADKPDTTLVTSCVNKAFRSISYKRALKSAGQPIFSNLISGCCNVNVLTFLHSQKSDIEIKQTSNLFMPNNSIRHPYFIRTYCFVSDDDHPVIA